MYLFQIMDFYAASGLSLLWICFFETIAVSWFYGAGRFSKNIEQMLGHRPAFFIFWHYCWLIFAPVVMGGVFFYYIYSYQPVTFGDYVYPKWSEAMGLCISFSSMIWVIAYAIYFMMTTPGTLSERWSVAITPVQDQIRKNPIKSVKSSNTEFTDINSPMTVEEIPLNLAEADSENVA